MTKVLAHAIASKNYHYDEGLVGVDMHCEFPDTVLRVVTVWFNREDLPNVEAYYKSPEGITPLELVV